MGKVCSKDESMAISVPDRRTTVTSNAIGKLEEKKPDLQKVAAESYEKDEYSEVIRCYSEVLAQGTELRGDQYARLADSHFMQNDYDQAIQNYQIAT